MIRVNASVNVGDDSLARYLEGVLRILHMDDAGCGLVRITIPDRGAKIIYGSAVGESGGWCGYGVEAAHQAEHLIEFRIHDAGRAAQKIQKGRGIDYGRSCEQEDLIQRAVDGGYDSAILQ